MDPISQAYYNQGFELRLYKLKGSAFQDLFSEIMEKCHPWGDFIRVRPWGRHGDRKNDGYLQSERTLFQVYAPNAMSPRETIRKIDEDFNGALPYWQQFFGKWVFVHNSPIGLGPEVTQKLLELGRAHPHIQIAPWGFEELRLKLFSLDDASIQLFLGPPLTSRHFVQLGFKDLKVVLESIARQQPTVDSDLRRVSSEKLRANALSDDVATLLKAGMRKAKLVERFFLEWHSPTFGEEVAQAFRDKYAELKRAELTPNEIFTALQQFAGGNEIASPEHQAAVLAVLAHLFETCDIFERPPEEVAQ